MNLTLDKQVEYSMILYCENVFIRFYPHSFHYAGHHLNIDLYFYYKQPVDIDREISEYFRPEYGK